MKNECNVTDEGKYWLLKSGLSVYRKKYKIGQILYGDLIINNIIKEKYGYQLLKFDLIRY